MKRIILIIVLAFLNLFNANGQWSEQTSGTFNHLLGIDFIDTLTGVCVGYNGTILKTTDGGQTWNDYSLVNSNIFWKVKFTNDTVGWIVGGNGTLYQTEDAGEIWEQNNIGTTDEIESIHFINDSIGWLVGSNGMIYKTEDKGGSWLDKSINKIDHLATIEFANDTLGLIVGKNILYRTINGGDTWDSLNTINNFLLDIFFLDAENVWICGYDGLIYKSENGGLTWLQQESNTTKGLQEIHFINENQGWAVGRHGTIVFTINGGETWELYPNTLSNNKHLVGLDFIDENHGWAAASGGSIIKYSLDIFLNQPEISMQSIYVYPNPVVTSAKIIFDNTLKVENIHLYSIDGQKLSSNHISKSNTNEFIFQRGNLTSGVYFLRVNEHNIEQTIKILVK